MLYYQLYDIIVWRQSIKIISIIEHRNPVMALESIFVLFLLLTMEGHGNPGILLNPNTIEHLPRKCFVVLWS